MGPSLFCCCCCRHSSGCQHCEERGLPLLWKWAAIPLVRRHHGGGGGLGRRVRRSCCTCCSDRDGLLHLLFLSRCDVKDLVLHLVKMEERHPWNAHPRNSPNLSLSGNGASETVGATWGMCSNWLCLLCTTLPMSSMCLLSLN